MGVTKIVQVPARNTGAEECSRQTNVITSCARLTPDERTSQNAAVPKPRSENRPNPMGTFPSHAAHPREQLAHVKEAL
jgi:hypothetical protein